MSKQKPSVARGTRDFGPSVMAKRNYILDTIKAVFQKFGFAELQTPAIENLNTLMGKYGEEGDQLLFKILNSGPFADKLTPEERALDSKALTFKISEKGLKYDLTVPFARYVAMNRGEIAFPFKRYQVQPVWRADRPQKGRYREFYQCDADVVGTKSLFCEVEILAMLQEVFQALNISVAVKMNNRKILTGISEVAGAQGQEATLAVAIDKLDKIGQEAVLAELATKGFSNEALEKLNPIFTVSGDIAQRLAFFKNYLSSSETGMLGVQEIESVLEMSKAYGVNLDFLDLDITLARGLSYYTGAIFEVKVLDVAMGSISGGGRYDNLTDLFGLPDVSGVGISFGVDRIYDVLDELDQFPTQAQKGTQALLANFDEATSTQVFQLLAQLRSQGIASEVYPELSKLKKQIEYASKRNIPYFLMIGSEEAANGQVQLKNMLTGEQSKVGIDEVAQNLLLN
jgi:histidyl-tRNA synthetase